MKRLAPFLHPVLLAIWPAVNVWAHNAGEVRAEGAFRWIAGLAAAAIALTLLLRPLVGGLHRAALGSSLAVLAFHFFPTQWAVEREVSPPAEGLKWLPVVGIFLLFMLVVALRRRGSRLHRWTPVLNVVAAGLVVVALFGARDQFWGPRAASDFGTTVEKTAASGVAPGDLPDIYYIILDAYGRHDVLRKYFDFDNTEFLQALESLGFYVARRSLSNYSQTRLSLTSSLNMEYLGSADLNRKVRRRPLNRRLTQRIAGARVPRDLASRGYRYDLVVGSLFWGTRDSPLATEVHDCEGVSDWDALMIESTLLGIWREELVVRDLREQILCQYTTLADLASRPGPKFVFAHIVSPHPPWLFDRHGNATTAPGEKIELKPESIDMKPYIEQVIFNNRKILHTVRRIQERSARPPVILLQADHGPAWRDGEKRRAIEAAVRAKHAGGDPVFFQPGTDFEPYLWSRMGILNAYHLPGFPQETLYPELTPVNTFRLIFDHYFSTEMGLLPDRAWYSFYQAPGALTEVTETVSSRPEPPAVPPWSG